MFLVKFIFLSSPYKIRELYKFSTTKNETKITIKFATDNAIEGC